MAVGRGTVNKVILVGRLGADPELRYTPEGTAVATLSLATNRVWKDKEGNQQEETEWHRVIAWRRLAEFCGEWLKKGSHIYLEGRLRTRSWEDRNGVKRFTTEVIADTIQMLDRKGEVAAEVPEPPEAAELPEEEAGSPPEDDLPF